MGTEVCQKVVIDRAGSYELLALRSAPRPSPGPGQVRVQVRAIGVNYADCVVRMGLYESAKKYVGWPITPGFEVAGVVDAVGAGVTRWAAGDEVIAVTRFGGYTTSLVADEDQLFALPEGWDFAQGAAFPAVHMTAWYAVHELAHPRPQHLALVHSAAGGVGGALLKLLARVGCETVGVVGGAHKIEAARQAGAGTVIDRSAQPLEAALRARAPEGYHVIFDANGAESLRQSWSLLRPPGKLVIYGFHTMMPRQGGRPKLGQLALGWLRTPRFNPLDMTGSNKSALAFNLSYLFAERALLAEAMGDLLGMVAEGTLTPPPVTRFRLEQVADAHRALESGRTVGKLVLEVEPQEG